MDEREISSKLTGSAVGFRNLKPSSSDVLPQQGHTSNPSQTVSPTVAQALECMSYGDILTQTTIVDNEMMMFIQVHRLSIAVQYRALWTVFVGALLWIINVRISGYHFPVGPVGVLWRHSLSPSLHPLYLPGVALQTHSTCLGFTWALGI